MTKPVDERPDLAHPVHPVNGVLTAPARPGLGMDLDEDKIEGRRELTFA